MSSFELRRALTLSASNSQTSLQSDNNSRAFDFEGLEESLVDNDLNESFESLNELDFDERRRPDDTRDDRDDVQRRREQSFHRIRDALIRDAQNRSEEDLDLIQNFLSLVCRQKHAQNQSQAKGERHSLNTKDFHTKRLLAKHMVLAEIESRDTRVLTHGERLDAYCVVACGSLRHVMSGCHVLSETTADDSCVDCVDDAMECPSRLSSDQKVRYLAVGDEFGASLDDRVVFGEIYTNEDFVWVLCVPHVVFDEICGEKSFKTVFDEKNEKIIEIRNQFTNELIGGTKERLLDILFEDGITCSDDVMETQFISDFLLTFRLFWSKARDSDDNCVKELLEKVIQNMKNERNAEKNLKIALFWITNHFQDFTRQLLNAFEASLGSKIHKKLFYFTLSSKSRARHVTITRSDRTSGLPFTLIGGYEFSTRLFIADVTDDTQDDISRGDRLISINGVDCHVMEVTRAVQLCRASTHLSLHVHFDPHLFHLLLDGQISRQNNETKRHLSQSDVKTTATTPLTTTNASFASLKPIQQLSSLSSVSSVVNNNNNWKQKVRQIVQNVTTNAKIISNNNNHASPQTTDMTTADAPEIIKIYFESDFRFLPIHVTTTARECIQLALIEFQLNANYSSRDFALYEYKLIDRTTATTAVKRLSDNFQNLVQNLSFDSRIYLKCVSGVTQTTLNDADITREITRDSHVNSLLTLDGEAIARELTERDFELFCHIESQQFIYDLTTADDNTTTDGRRAELKSFESKTNSEMFWTIHQILTANSMQKRVKTVKRLIRIALFCRALNNFNALFAITSGLSHQSIQRMKSLWERIPQKSLNKLKKLYQLMDPSKNFCAFRSQLRHCSPPIIPFFPLVKKDLSFIFLANQTLITCSDNKSILINWEKMRLLSQKIKEVQQMTTTQTTSPTTAPNSPTTPTTAMTTGISFARNSNDTNHKKVWERQRMRKRVQHFLDKSFSEIIFDENVLFEKSNECEPQTTPVTSSARPLPTAAEQKPSAIPVMPSPTLSSHSASSSPSLSSSTTNSSDIQSMTSSQQRLRFGARDDSGLRKLLALSDNCVSVVHNGALRPPFCHSMHFQSPQRQSLPVESSSVTSLRRLEALQQMSRFRQHLGMPLSDVRTTTALTTTDVGRRQHWSSSGSSRPSLPSYDQTIQRMKKKFNKNEENVV